MTKITITLIIFTFFGRRLYLLYLSNFSAGGSSDSCFPRLAFGPCKHLEGACTLLPEGFSSSSPNWRTHAPRTQPTRSFRISIPLLLIFCVFLFKFYFCFVPCNPDFCYRLCYCSSQLLCWLDVRRHIITRNWWPPHGVTTTFCNRHVLPCHWL